MPRSSSSSQDAHAGYAAFPYCLGVDNQPSAEADLWAQIEAAAELQFSDLLRLMVKRAADDYAGASKLMESRIARAELVGSAKRPGGLDLLLRSLQGSSSAWKEILSKDQLGNWVAEYDATFASGSDPLFAAGLEGFMVALETHRFFLAAAVERLHVEVAESTLDTNAERRSISVQLVSELADAFTEAGGIVTASGGYDQKRTGAIASPFVRFVRQVMRYVDAEPLVKWKYDSEGNPHPEDDAWSAAINERLAQWRRRGGRS